MATLINGNKEEIHTTTPVSGEQPSTLHLVAHTVWDTVRSKTFALGTLVGAALMYVGIRAAQAYLSAAQDPDQPF
jgi:hypothetical protein